MTNKDILEHAISKAIDGGLTGYWAIRYAQCQELDEMEFLVGDSIYEDKRSVESLIFSHDFAKALWGEKPRAFYRIGVKGKGKEMIVHDEKFLKPYEYHLQQMVIADDPIKYLGDNI